MNFEFLVHTIQDTHNSLQQSAAKAVNTHLTIRNWLIGFYIVEFEQKGEDRAKYGEKLLDELALRLNTKDLGARNLKLFRQFYFAYPQIVQTLSAQLKNIGFVSDSIQKLTIIGRQNIENQESEIVQTTSAQFISHAQVPSEKLVSRLSFSHLSLLLPIKDPLKRTFYEIECIKANWSVSELKRQISTLYFERSGISQNPEKLSLLTLERAEQSTPADIIKSPFTFEFLGLKAKDVVEESDLEQALIDHLQDFLLELGHGFCFEARQKRILIDDEYYFIDLIFYNRILKCHVLVELKNDSSSSRLLE